MSYLGNCVYVCDASDIIADDRARHSCSVVGDSEGLAASIDEVLRGQAVALGPRSVRIHLFTRACFEPAVTEDVTS
jgi:hypothetical protein